MPIKIIPIKDIKNCIAQLKKGDERAFQLIYNEYGSQLLGYTRRHVKSTELAEEIVHDVFVKLWKHREHIKDESTVKAYIFTICKNHILNTLRKVSLDFSRNVDSDIVEDINPEKQMMSKELHDLIAKAVSALPKQRQIVFQLSRNEEKSYEEISLALGIGKGTVQDHLVKAKRSIREYLIANGELTV